MLQATFEKLSEELQALVTDKRHNNLLGRTWIGRLNIDLNKLFIRFVELEAETPLQTMLARLSTLFSGDLGCWTKLKVHLQFKPDVKPKFIKPHPIPLAT